MPHLTKDDLAAFLPHAGSMRLLDRTASWDESSIPCHTKTHQDPANPLRRGACLDAVAGIEYAAQAMGVHVGLLNGGMSSAGSIGYVGGVRDVLFGIDRLDDCPDEKDECRVGDKVRIIGCRPLSKNKCWRLVEIIARAPEV